LLGLDEALLNTNGHRHRQRPEFITGSLGGNGWGVKGFGAAFVKGARSLVRVVWMRGRFVRKSWVCKIISYDSYDLALVLRHSEVIREERQ